MVLFFVVHQGVVAETAKDKDQTEIQVEGKKEEETGVAIETVDVIVTVNQAVTLNLHAAPDLHQSDNRNLKGVTVEIQVHLFENNGIFSFAKWYRFVFFPYQ